MLTPSVRRLPIGAFILAIGIGITSVLSGGCSSPCCRNSDSVEARLRDLELRVDQLDGGDLLKRWPPSQWGKERMNEILQREIKTGVYRTDEEAEFIKNFDAWKAALDRRNAATRNIEPAPPK